MKNKFSSLNLNSYADLGCEHSTTHHSPHKRVARPRIDTAPDIVQILKSGSLVRQILLLLSPLRLSILANFQHDFILFHILVDAHRRRNSHTIALPRLSLSSTRKLIQKEMDFPNFLPPPLVNRQETLMRQ